MDTKENKTLDEEAKHTPYTKVDANFLIAKQTSTTSPEEEDILHTKFHIFSKDFTLEASIVAAKHVDTVP